jgi:hypothetical protein
MLSVFIFVVILCLAATICQSEPEGCEAVTIRGKPIAFFEDESVFSIVNQGTQRRVLFDGESLEDSNRLLIVQRNNTGFIDGTVASISKGVFLVERDLYHHQNGDKVGLWKSDYKWDQEKTDFPVVIKTTKHLKNAERLGSDIWVIYGGSEDDLLRIVSDPMVQWVDNFKPVKPLSQHARNALLPLNLRRPDKQTGAGIIISVLDDGIDPSHCAFYDPDHPIPVQDQYEPSAHGKISSLITAVPGLTDYRGKDMSHGTMTASAAAAYRCGAVIGLASSSKIAFYDFTSSQDPDDGIILVTNKGNGMESTVTVFEYLQKIHRIGQATVASNSWGANYDGHYTWLDSEFDRVAYENPELFIVAAAGNDGATGYPFVCSPASAKNIASVGATMGGATQYSLLYPQDSKNNPEFYEVDQVIDFSSRGPLKDGRRSPLYYAPGVYQTVAYGYYNYVAGHSHATLMSGTSASCPYVAGQAAEVQSQHKTRTGDRSSSSLVHATFIAETRPVKRTVRRFPDGTVRPIDLDSRHSYGYGVVQPTSNTSFLDGHSIDSKIENQKVNAHCFLVTWNTPVLSIGMFWTDPPGFPHSSRTLINDLNLVVFVDGMLMHAVEDHVHNHEKVVLQNVERSSIMRLVIWEQDGFIQGTNPYQNYSLFLNSTSLSVLHECGKCMAHDITACPGGYKYCNVTDGLMTPCLPSSLEGVEPFGEECRGQYWKGVLVSTETQGCYPVECDKGFYLEDNQCWCIPEIVLGQQKCDQSRQSFIPLLQSSESVQSEVIQTAGSDTVSPSDQSLSIKLVLIVLVLFCVLF